MSNPKANDLRIRLADSRNFAVERYSRIAGQDGAYYEWTHMGWYSSLRAACLGGFQANPRWTEGETVLQSVKDGEARILEALKEFGRDFDNQLKSLESIRSKANGSDD